MITAIDTSVLLDVFGADQQYGPRSRAMRWCVVATRERWWRATSYGPRSWRRSVTSKRRALVGITGVDFDAIGEVAAIALDRRGASIDSVVAPAPV